jgi:hypothetical protein
MAAQGIVAKYLEMFAEFPQRQKAASFTINREREKLAASFAGASSKVAKAA